MLFNYVFEAAMNSEFPQAVTFLYTSDINRAAAFWGNTLGLPMALTQRPPGADMDLARIYAVSSSAFIGVVMVDTKSKNDAGVVKDGVVVTLVSSKVDEWAERLKAQNIPIEKGPILNERYNIYHIFFRDPDGHLIEIQEFKDPLWPTVEDKSSHFSTSTISLVAAATVVGGLIGILLSYRCRRS